MPIDLGVTPMFASNVENGWSSQIEQLASDKPANAQSDDSRGPIKYKLSKIDQDEDSLEAKSYRQPRQ